MSNHFKTLTAHRYDDLIRIANPAAAASVHEDGIAILHTGNGNMFVSNEAGARIWRGVERQLSLQAIAEEISTEYQIPQTTAREHTAHFLADLERHQLIQPEVVS